MKEPFGRPIDIQISALSEDVWRISDRLEMIPWPINPDELQQIALDLAALSRKAEEWAAKLKRQGQLFDGRDIREVLG